MAILEPDFEPGTVQNGMDGDLFICVSSVSLVLQIDVQVETTWGGKFQTTDNLLEWQFSELEILWFMSMGFVTALLPGTLIQDVVPTVGSVKHGCKVSRHFLWGLSNVWTPV